MLSSSALSFWFSLALSLPASQTHTHGYPYNMCMHIRDFPSHSTVISVSPVLRGDPCCLKGLPGFTAVTFPASKTGVWELLAPSSLLLLVSPGQQGSDTALLIYHSPSQQSALRVPMEWGGVSAMASPGGNPNPKSHACCFAMSFADRVWRITGVRAARDLVQPPLGLGTESRASGELLQHGHSGDGTCGLSAWLFTAPWVCWRGPCATDPQLMVLSLGAVFGKEETPLCTQ